MAYLLLRNISAVEKHPVRRLYACGCQYLHQNGSSTDFDEQACSRTSFPGGWKSTYRNSQITTQEERPWMYSSLYYKSRFIHTSPVLTNMFLSEDLILKRCFHTSALLRKEDSMVEKSVKALKEELEKEKEKGIAIKPNTNETEVKEQEKQTFIQKKVANFKAALAEARRIGFLVYVKKGFKAFVKHWMDGFKLFWTDIKICAPLMVKYILKGRSSLKRREYKMLIKTFADLFRMVPLIPALLIPFAEIVIPLYIYLGMMPTVFSTEAEKEERNRQILQKKLEYGALLAASLHSMVPLNRKKNDSIPSKFAEFTDFMETVKDTEKMPSNKDIIRFSRLFEDHLTLDDLSVTQLQSMCKLLNIGFIGEIPSRRILRFQLGMKLRELEVDDRSIQKEGIESLAVWELQAANRARGMRAIGVPENRLKMQLEQWLELHLKESIPTSLLLLSRVMYLDERLTQTEKLKSTIAMLPETTVTKVQVVSTEALGEDVDKVTKRKMLNMEQKAIKIEKQQEEAELAAEKLKEEEEALKKAAELEEAQKEAEEKKEEVILEPDVVAPEVKTEPQVEVIKEVEAPTPTPVAEKVITETVVPQPDIAEPIVAATSEEFTADETLVEELKEERVTSDDLENIEQAIEDMGKHHKEEFEDVKEEFEDYKEEMEDMRALCVDTKFEEHVKETAGALLLRSKLDKYLSKLDTKISRLQDEKMELQEKLEEKELKLKFEKGGKQELMDEISDKKHNLISVNDVLLSLKRLQKLPDDVRMQKVLQILDTDEDGLIDINDVLKVTEELGRENLKLNKDQVSTVMGVLRKEAALEVEMKQKDKEEKEIEMNNEKTVNGNGNGTDQQKTQTGS